LPNQGIPCDSYSIGDRGLQRILRDRILRTRFRAEFSHSLCL
jgi:hypothetical protein